jgi:tricorn protease
MRMPLIYDEPVADSRYLRFPNLHGDTLAFVADDDVWLAPVSGGRAWRISADQAPAESPRLSPDGTLVTWTSWRDGPPEIYLAGTQDGGSARVSYWSSDSTRVRGWSPDGELIAITGTDQPFPRRAWAYAIPVSEGAGQFSAHRRLPFGPVADLFLDPAATALLTASVGLEPAFWKRYRGGRAGRLWVAEGGPGNRSPFRRLLADVDGQFACPMLIGGRLAFISDFEGTGNLYSCALDGSGLRRHTDNDGFYVRNASTDGSRVVYQSAGDLWLLDDLSADSAARRLDITLGSPAAGRATRFISADDHVDDLSVDQTGQASLLQLRGTVHWIAHRDGPARALSEIPGPIARNPRMLGTSGTAVWVVDLEGGDALEVGPVDGSEAGRDEPRRRIAAGQIGWVHDLAAAPDGGTVAVAARDGGLFVVDVESGAVTELARSGRGPITGLAFAPDSAWLAWSQPAEDPLRLLRMARLSDREVIDVTDGRFVDTDPSFTPDGLYLGFLSRRTFDPVYDAHVFDLSFPYGSRPFLLTLAAATPSPFGPLLSGRPVGGGKDEDKPGPGRKRGKAAAADEASDAGEQEGDGAKGASGSGAAKNGAARNGSDDGVKPVAIDLDGLGSRIVQIPVPESRYRSLRAVEGGLAWLNDPLTGNLGEGGARLDDSGPRPALEYFDIKRARCTELMSEASWFEPSGDGSKLAVYDRHQLVVIPANRKAEADSSDERVSVDLARARFLAQPAAQWRAAYTEAGRRMRHEFWIPDMGDVDWDAVLEQYRPLLDRISTADEFSDLLHETVAELGSSHAYVNGAGGFDQTGHVAGLLGADLAAGPDGWTVSRVLPGEASDPRARSPLEAPGAGISVGDTIIAIDGQPVDVAKGPGPLLIGTAGKPVELTVRRATDGEVHRAVVIPLADERRLRYQDWVASKRRLVRELSDGRLGYLHVPDMMSEGWSDFHRDLRRELYSDGLIMDVRSNRGGHTSQLVVEKLARRIIGWDIVRNAAPESYPSQSPRGPVVAVTDESAGSDGDIVTAAIRLMKIGPVVGTRTWGGVIGIEGWHQLVDGTTMTVPKASFWFAELGWGVENYGVDPDVEVLISPDDWAADNDTQLREAVRLALQALEQQPAATAPSTADRPSRRRPALPPRPSAG